MWNPVDDPKQARVRELYVLNRMQVAGDIDSEQAGAAYGSALPPIVAAAEPEAQTDRAGVPGPGRAGAAHYGDATLFNSGGMQVKTTLDLNLQQAATQALGQVLPKQKGLNAAIVAVDPRNGDLRALAEHKAGGYVQNGEDLADPPVADINRSSGSTIKPFTLAVALEHGHTLDESSVRARVRAGRGRLPAVQRRGRRRRLHLGVRARAVDQHRVRAARGTGRPEPGRRSWRGGPACRSAISLRADPAVHRKGVVCPSYALGVPISPLSEADAYGSFVDHGMHHAVRSVLAVRTPAQGQLFKAAAAPPGTRVMPASIADEVTTAMQGVVESGTGMAARQPFPVYGKTGTTDNFTDAWFTGCTRTLCITVWMGDTKPHELRDASGAPVYGGTVPAKLFARRSPTIAPFSRRPSGVLASVKHCVHGGPEPCRSRAALPPWRTRRKAALVDADVDGDLAGARRARRSSGRRLSGRGLCAG